MAIIGCGRLGQYYAEVYSTYPDTEIVAIAEYNEERRKVIGERFGVKDLYPDVHALLSDIVPDIAAVVTPTKYMKEAVVPMPAVDAPLTRKTRVIHGAWSVEETVLYGRPLRSSLPGESSTHVMSERRRSTPRHGGMRKNTGQR